MNENAAEVNENGAKVNENGAKVEISPLREKYWYNNMEDESILGENSTPTRYL